MSFTGLIAELPIGHDGFNGTRNLARVAPSQIIQALNISYDRGTVSKEGGSAKYNASALSGTPSVLGGYDWHPVSGTQRSVIVTSAGDILKDSGAGTYPVTLASGLTVSSSVPTFVTGGKEVAANNRKLFIFTGQNAVQVLSADGATTAALATPPADWTGANQPTVGCIHEFRLWGAGNANDPHRVYYSITTSHEDFTAAGSGSLSIYPGEGDKIVGLVPFGTGIIVFKFPHGIYYIDTSNATVANWRINRITGGVGCCGVRGFVQIDRDVMFMDAVGDLHLVSATDQFGDFLSSTVPNIHESFSDFVDENVNKAQLSKAQAIYYEAKREVHFAVAQTGSSVNNIRLVVDMSRDDLARPRYADKDTCVSMWLKRDSDGVSHPASGDNAGFVWDLDQETKSKDGAGYSGLFQTPHDDFSRLDPSLGTKRKNFAFLEVVVEPQGNYNLSVDTFIDGEQHETVQFNMGFGGAVLGSFILGTDVLAGTQALNKKRRITGSGRRFSILGYNSGADQDFSIAKMYVHFTPSDERL